eukprot:8312324-Pyramimonas_sp.AAC.1
MGSSTEGLSGKIRMTPPSITALPAHVSRPHGERCLRLQWGSSHGTAAPFRHTPHTLRCPIGNPAEGISGEVRMAPPRYFGTPLARFVAPWEPRLRPQWERSRGTSAHFGTTLIGFVAPW